MLQTVKGLKKIAIIEKDCDSWKRLQKKIHVSNRMNLSSNINEGIRAVLFFKRKDFTRTRSTKKHKNHKTLTSDFHLDVFMRIKSMKNIKSTKSTKCQTDDLLLLRCFYAHKNAVFYVFVRFYVFCAFCACEIFS